ncbi:MAG: hypothetical protein KBC33_00470 [Candidatus Pacebacteria bacterium]|nr:hypothetical protein [Candidatus Paceibacterota bacterium]
MNTVTWSIGMIGCLYASTACASQYTNEVFITKTTLSSSLWDRWPQEMVLSGRRIVYDRFGFPSSLNWLIMRDTPAYDVHEFIADYGESTVYKIMGSAAREAAVETLPVGEYEDFGIRLGSRITGFMSGLFRGSVGNTTEEEVETVSATPSYSSLRHIVNFEWNEPKDSWSGEYGWRPWRDNPYIYLNSNFGHHAGRQFLRTEFRCFGYLRPNSFGIVRTEASALITVSEKSQLVVGGFAYPFESEKRYDPQGSVRFESFWGQTLASVGVASSIHGPFWNFSFERKF